MVKYVYDDIIEKLTSFSNPSGGYVPLQTQESIHTILGYFGDEKRTMCAGYSRSLQYLQNRLGIPTIVQVGDVVRRDANGNITGIVDSHGWNITQMENGEWYFSDVTSRSSNMLLRGRGAGGKLPGEVLYTREITADMIYPECAIEDYRPPVRSMQAPVRQAAPPVLAMR